MYKICFASVSLHEGFMNIHLYAFGNHNKLNKKEFILYKQLLYEFVSTVCMRVCACVCMYSISLLMWA